MAADSPTVTQNEMQDGSFTLAGYRALLERTLEMYPMGGFELLGDPDLQGKSVCMLRHDIDISPARALQVARIEAELGVRSTYTVLMTGRFYNPLERDVRDVLLEIASLGHDLGLHFDAEWHEAEDEDRLTSELQKEAETLSRLLRGNPISMFSFHDPSEQAMGYQAPQYAGLWNAYSAVQRQSFSYLSDSNGYWRFRTWSEALDEHPERLHILIHPEWWVENYLPPAERISTAIDERSVYMWQKYCAGLVATQRVNKSSITEALDILPAALGDAGDRLAQQWLAGDRAGAFVGLLRQVGRRPGSSAEAAAPFKVIAHRMIDGGVDPHDDTVRAAFVGLAELLRQGAA